MNFPLLVQFEYHPASTEAAAMAEYLRSVVNDDPGVPGLRIPTCFTPDDYSFAPPEPRLNNEADRVLIVLLADDQLVARGRRLQLVDCQNLFCEVSKYARVAHPEIRGESGRTRIKQKFSPHSKPIPQWYPPKWGLSLPPLGAQKSETIPQPAPSTRGHLLGRTESRKASVATKEVLA